MEQKTMQRQPSMTPPRLPRERHRQILQRLAENGAVRVAELAEELTVAEETIRRDLDKLESLGRLVRTHGGALTARNDPIEAPMAVRQTTCVIEKRMIAQRAAALVEPGDVLALDASTSALELARLLPEIPLTVVTNGLETIRILSARPHVETISTGGALERDARCQLGPLAEATLGRFAVSKAFFSCKGIDLRRGVSEANLKQGAFKRAMLDAADQAFLLADRSKFGVKSTAFFARLDDVDAIITDDCIDAQYVDLMKQLNVSLMIAPRDS